MDLKRPEYYPHFTTHYLILPQFTSGYLRITKAAILHLNIVIDGNGQIHAIKTFDHDANRR